MQVELLLYSLVQVLRDEASMCGTRHDRDLSTWASSFELYCASTATDNWGTCNLFVS